MKQLEDAPALDRAKSLAAVHVDRPVGAEMLPNVLSDDSSDGGVRSVRIADEAGGDDIPSRKVGDVEVQRLLADRYEESARRRTLEHSCCREGILPSTTLREKDRRQVQREHRDRRRGRNPKAPVGQSRS